MVSFFDMLITELIFLYDKKHMSIRTRFIRPLRKYLYLLKVDIMDVLPGTPRDFAWKVRWRMRHDRNPLFIELADKYAVKSFVESRGVQTAKLYYVTDKPETIPFDTLPEACFIKANHGSLWNILCKGGEFYLFGNGEKFSDLNNISNFKLTREECIQQCKIWLKSTYSKKEWAYRHIPPKIMIEEVLFQRGGGEFKDYKFHVFDGGVKALSLVCPTYRRRNKILYLDRDWQAFKLDLHGEKIPDQVPEKPDSYDEMVEAAEKLAKGLDYVRIDLYDTTRGIIFGEMTFYPSGGWPGTPTSDPEFNQWLGDHWSDDYCSESSKSF